MSTAFVVSPAPQPRVGFDQSKFRVTLEECIVDLNLVWPAIEQWAADRKLFNGTDWRVRRTVEGTTQIRVPAGFRYDGASIPWWAHPIMGDRELYEVAGLFHDWAYRALLDRAMADWLFWYIARSGSKSVTPVRGFLGWAALRVGGWKPYRDYQRVADA